MKWRGWVSKVKLLPLGLSLGAFSVSVYLTVTGVLLLGEPPESAKKEEPKPPTGGSTAEGSGTLELSRAILKRNIFDSTVGSLEWLEAPPPRAQEEAEKAGDPAEAATTPEAAAIADCASDLRLTAVFMSEDETRSFAVMQRGATAAKQVNIGGELDQVRLLALAPTLAYVREPNGVTCRLLLYRSVTTPTPVAAQAKAEPKKPAAKAGLSEADLDAGITSLGGDNYRVSRELITRAMLDASSVVRGTKFLPQAGEKRSNGVKIQGLNNKAALHKLGVRNNDILRSLNGIDLSTPDGMLGAYALLKQESTLTLAITRGGASKTLSYRLE